VTWLDALPIVLVIVYAGLGYFGGLLRRVIGLIALYLAFVGATNMGLQAAQIFQQSSNLETPDARIYGFFGIVIAVIVIVEAAAQLASSQIQVGALVFNRVLGVIVGVLNIIPVVGVILGLVAAPFGVAYVLSMYFQANHEGHLVDAAIGQAPAPRGARG